MRKGFTEHKGVGKMIHTGNEADLKLTDFLEYVGDDEGTEVILLHIEGLRDGGRFCEVGRRVARRKPVIAFKAGVTSEGARAAASHTGALAGSGRIYSGLFRQLGMIEAPEFEIMLDMGYAFLQQPRMTGDRVCVITMGGSWGVVITDSLAEHGLRVPEPSAKLQQTLRGLGFPVRASTRNPIDFGAAGGSLPPDVRSALLRELVDSGEFDALLAHGLCMSGHVTEESPPERKFFVEYQKSFIREAVALGHEKGVVVLPVSHLTGQESQIYKDTTEGGIPVYNRADDAAAILAALRSYTARRES
jgi:acyl-CoA synthetase (NDP forming)